MPTETLKEQEKELTTEELSELAKTTTDALFGPPMTKPKEASPTAEEQTAAKKVEDDKAAEVAAEKAAEEAKAAEAKAKADEAAKAPPAAAPAPAAATPTASQIADEVAARMAPKAEPAKEVPQLSDVDQHNREVIEFMAKENPSKFGALLPKFDKFVTAEKGYREKWEKENPGAEFDPLADDHEDFYKANDPIVNLETEFNRAENRLDARQTTERILSESKAQERREHAIKAVTEKLRSHTSDIGNELLSAVDPDLAKIDPKGKSLREIDPLADASIRPYMPALAAKTAELIKAFTPDLNYQFSRNNPVHEELLRDIQRYEGELMELPEAKRKSDDGRKFSPITEWNRMTPEQQREHWTIWLEPNSIRALLVRDFSAKAKEDLTLLRGASGKSSNGSASKSTPKAADSTPPKPAPDTASKRFPNTGGSAETVTGGSKDAIVTKSDAKSITSVLFGT